MKKIPGLLLLNILAMVTFAQTAPIPEPISKEEPSFFWGWWLVGVILLIGIGLLIYFAIKKNPRKDVR